MLFAALATLSAGLAAHECPEWVEVKTELGLQMMRVSHIETVTNFDNKAVFISKEPLIKPRF